MTETNYSHIPYLPHTEEERHEMLKAIGLRSFEQLVSHIPADVRAKQLDLAPGLSELELCQHVSGLAAKNTPASQQMSFLGGGSARRYVPAVVPSIISRSEFATAYTPYQPEVSQGSLQIIYEFQTAVCLLTAMEVANASMYDGPTACAEAALMAARLTNRKKVIAGGATNPEYRMVTETYVKSCGLTYKEVAADSGVIEANKLSLDDDVGRGNLAVSKLFWLPHRRASDCRSVPQARGSSGGCVRADQPGLVETTGRVRCRHRRR